MIIALLYAQQDFDTALKIVRSAGWDVARNTLLTGVFMALNTYAPGSILSATAIPRNSEHGASIV